MKKNKTLAERRAGRRKAAPFIGGIFVFFAVAGLVSTIMFCTNIISNFFDNSPQRARYESFISPVVMMNPVPFSRVENIDQGVVLQASLWAALMGENRGSYTYDENGLLLVPSSDMDVAAVRLFGPGVTLQHQSFDDVDASYLFDPEISAYRVPSISKVAYSPYITEMVKDGDNIILTVGYVAPGNIWSTDPQNTNHSIDTPIPEKYMNYTLTKWEQGYYISAVADIDGIIMS